MKTALLALFASLTLATTAHPAEWKKTMGCFNAESALTVDLDSTNPEHMQVVIEGRETVTYISQRMQGNSVVVPANLHFYDNGNKLVISDLLASESFNPATPDPYRIAVRNGAGDRAALSWVNGSELNPVDQFWFYNCRFY